MIQGTSAVADDNVQPVPVVTVKLPVPPPAAVEALLVETGRIPAVTSVEIAPVDLASFDALYRERVQ